MTDTDIVSERLVTLRKHLGERLGQELTMQSLAEKADLKYDFLKRLESGLKGSMDSLLTLVRYYHSQGYNLDWILLADNSEVPMISFSGGELLKIENDVNELAQTLNQSYAKISSRLRTLGYHPSMNTALAESSPDVHEPAGFAL
ncbi:hypothetical protein GCM10028818_55430 [Spirosoma horti]